MQSDEIRLFDATAPLYNAGVKYLTFGLYSRFLRYAIKQMNLQPGEKVLDVCTGTGLNLHEIVDRIGEHGEIVGVDLSSGMLKVADTSFGKRNNVHFVYGDITTMDSHHGYFDKALTSFCIHEIEPERRALALDNIHGMLKDGGLLFIADYNNIPYEQHGPFARLALRILERDASLTYLSTDIAAMLIEHGFTDIQQFPFFNENLLVTQARKSTT